MIFTNEFFCSYLYVELFVEILRDIVVILMARTDFIRQIKLKKSN